MKLNDSTADARVFTLSMCASRIHCPNQVPCCTDRVSGVRRGVRIGTAVREERVPGPIRAAGLLPGRFGVNRSRFGSALILWPCARAAECWVPINASVAQATSLLATSPQVEPRLAKPSAVSAAARMKSMADKLPVPASLNVTEHLPGPMQSPVYSARVSAADSTGHGLATLTNLYAVPTAKRKAAANSTHSFGNPAPKSGCPTRSAVVLELRQQAGSRNPWSTGRRRTRRTNVCVKRSVTD